MKNKLWNLSCGLVQSHLNEFYFILIWWNYLVLIILVQVFEKGYDNHGLRKLLQL